VTASKSGGRFTIIGGSTECGVACGNFPLEQVRVAESCGTKRAVFALTSAVFRATLDTDLTVSTKPTKPKRKVSTMKKKIQDPEPRAAFTSIRVIERADGAFSLLGDAKLKLTGSVEQLIIWLLEHIAVTCAEVWFLNDDEPHCSRIQDVPKFWKPVLVITQREGDEWIVTTFGKQFRTFTTADLLMFLTHLLPSNLKQAELDLDSET
jgi:hypothetical protein